MWSLVHRGTMVPLNDAGAATWGNGMTGITGTVSSSNSLVGSTAGDRVSRSVAPLSNGNYVVGVHGAMGLIT
jgi:hypothetical protein